jgi:hypothetical protein
MQTYRYLLASTLILGLQPALRAAEQPEAPPPRIQLAILLDTSGSMQGLIDQAKTQLWRIVNEFATAKKDGAAPLLEVALYEYGKSTIPASEGYLRMIVPLTTDLDRVSAELFALSTNGGEEYCGRVIKAAAEELAWSPAAGDLKLIFIAGNEPFTQGDVDYREAAKLAVSRGIIVNTIHCGSELQGIDGKWKEGALLAEGKFMNIDQNQVAVHIPAPQDAEIERLGRELNRTYLAFGALGLEAAARQEAQDAAVERSVPGSATQRAICKASQNYRNVAWDLVDALKEGHVKLEELKRDELPEELREMAPQERKAFVERRAREREEIQKRIQELDAARRKHVAEEMNKRSAAGEKTLEAAVIASVREQARAKSFELE